MVIRFVLTMKARFVKIYHFSYIYTLILTSMLMHYNNYFVERIRGDMRWGESSRNY